MKIGTKPVLVATLKPNAFAVTLKRSEDESKPVVTVKVDGQLFGEASVNQAFSWEGSRTVETIELQSTQDNTEVEAG